MRRGSRFLILYILLFFWISGSFGIAVDKKTSARIDEAIARNKAQIIKIRRFIHMNPELSNREFETSKLIASRLLSLGLDVETGIAKTGVVGLLHGDHPGPTIGIRADMDALPIQELVNVPFRSLNPGVMHACGHDIHTSIVLGTAYVLNSFRDKIKGNIKFIFQPAEEGPPPGEDGGAELMIKEGVLEDPPVKAIFGLHVWPDDLGSVAFSSGPIMASSDRFSITIKGKSSHGARPHEGIDAITLASHVIVNIQTIISRFLDATDPAVISVGKISGGTKANIIAESVRFDGTVRTLSEINRQKIRHYIEKIVEGITDAYGADYEMLYREGTPPLYNHPELAKIMTPTLYNIVGKENVFPITPQMIAEDFSLYCQKIPGFYFFLGVKNPRRRSMSPLHSPNFNPDERSISLGIKIMCHLLLDSLAHQNQETIGTN
ncbi:MAG: amidohydrolase [Candidatus Aminicenantes bacterium]|nr:amidohydrolase [Candidatus Aminicenantes bacterium]